jgi:hypothetical protein
VALLCPLIGSGPLLRPRGVEFHDHRLSDEVPASYECPSREHYSSLTCHHSIWFPSVFAVVRINHIGFLVSATQISES